MSFHDLSASREAETGTGKIVPIMQSPKSHEDLISGFGSDPDAVVLNGKDMFSFLTDGRNVDMRCLVSAELDRVADEVLEELADLGRVRSDFGERIVGHQDPL